MYLFLLQFYRDAPFCHTQLWTRSADGIEEFFEWQHPQDDNCNCPFRTMKVNKDARYALIYFYFHYDENLCSYRVTSVCRSPSSTQVLELLTIQQESETGAFEECGIEYQSTSESLYSSDNGFVCMFIYVGILSLYGCCFQ